jgi:hypothetical protein
VRAKGRQRRNAEKGIMLYAEKGIMLSLLCRQRKERRIKKTKKKKKLMWHIYIYIYIYIYVWLIGHILQWTYYIGTLF